jgi:MFS family permease
MHPTASAGLYTSFIQITATAGLFLSLLVILGCRSYLGNEAFESWGWRFPFLLSIVLLGRVGLDPHAAERDRRCSSR